MQNIQKANSGQHWEFSVKAVSESSKMKWMHKQMYTYLYSSNTGKAIESNAVVLEITFNRSDLKKNCSKATSAKFFPMFFFLSVLLLLLKILFSILFFYYFYFFLYKDHHQWQNIKWITTESIEIQKQNRKKVRFLCGLLKTITNNNNNYNEHYTKRSLQ